MTGKFNHTYFMRKALNEAVKGKGMTYPNPAVGAVIVHNNKIIGRGYHKAAGLPHAEVEAVKSVNGKIPQNSAIYVTLEPCCHYGKTPPCVDLLIKNKFRKVIAGSIDPNPLVAGKGLKILQENGIEVLSGILKNECDELNEDFFFSIQNKKTFVTVKAAMTLDAKIASSSGDSKWITNEECRAYGHHLRKINSIILTGINTVLNDNPSYNIRLPESLKQKSNIAIMDYSLKFPPNAELLEANQGTRIIIFTDEKKINSGKCRNLIKNNIEVAGLKSVNNKFLDIREALNYLYNQGFNSALAEAGGKILYSLFNNKLVNKIHFMYAPKILGNGLQCVDGWIADKISECLKIDISSIKTFDDNFMITGKVDYDN